MSMDDDAIEEMDAQDDGYNIEWEKDNDFETVGENSVMGDEY
jgi:hypothetical protein